MHHHLSFPETLTTPNGVNVVVRPMGVADREAFCRFFGRLPERDRLFFQENLAVPANAERWISGLESGRAFCLVGFDREEIVAHASLHRRLYGWTRHVGYMQVAIVPEFRGRGIAGLLVHRIVELATQIGLDKVVAEVLTEQRRERKILERHGFHKEAILHDHATDQRGNKHNVLLLANNVYELWRRMEDLIIDKEFEVIP
jgi:RimJ/RimL family protein N-acetyltransferase